MDIIGFGEEMSELALWPSAFELEVLRMTAMPNISHKRDLPRLFSWWLRFARQKMQPFFKKKREPLFGAVEIQIIF